MGKEMKDSKKVVAYMNLGGIEQLVLREKCQYQPYDKSYPSPQGNRRKYGM